MPRTIPVMPSEVPGNYLTGALWNASVKALGDFTTGTPRFKGYATTGQSVASGTSSAPISINLDSSSVDSDGGHSATVNTSRYTVQVAGLYAAIGCLAWTTNGTGIRGICISVNGAISEGSAVQSPAFSAATWAETTSTIVQCNVGDYIELQGWQNTGSPLATIATTGFGPSLSAWLISQ